MPSRQRKALFSCLHSSAPPHIPLSWNQRQQRGVIQAERYGDIYVQVRHDCRLFRCGSWARKCASHHGNIALTGGDAFMH